LLGTLLYYWFNKVNKSNAEAVYQITEIQKRELIKDYKLKALGENTVNLKRENDQASIELKKSMADMSKEMTKLADTQVEAWQAIKENKLNIQNLQAANKFITEDIFKKHFVTIILSGLVVAWTFIKDLINTGAESKFNNQVVNVVVTSDKIDDHIDTLITDKIELTMGNPLVWLEVLDSEYIKEKEDRIYKKVESDLLKKDSIDMDFINILGEALGIRNEDVIPKLGELMKDYTEGNLNSIRRTNVSF